MIKKLIGCLILVMCMLCLQSFSKRVQAATTEIFPKEISSPGQVVSYYDSGEGLAYSKEYNSGITIYTFTVSERGWYIIAADSNTFYNELHLYNNSSMTSQMRSYGYELESEYLGYYRLRKAYYLEAGTYYMRDSIENSSNDLYAFFLPDSAVISHKLVKDKDNNGYTDTITFTPHLGTTYLTSGIVDPDDINFTYFDPLGCSDYTTDANDVYSITANGEYTVIAVFNDPDWKDFPVMYSFSVHDIGKSDKNDKTSDDDKRKEIEKDTNTSEAKLNYDNKTIKIGENFKLKVTGAKIVSFKSSKKSVAKVTASGKVVGKKKGTATIKVTCDNGETYKCKVTVKK